LHITVGRKRKKFAIGIYPLEKITLPITFKALEPDKIKFIPLETEREMSGLEILQRHPTGKEYAHLLAGKTKFPIFIDAKNQILSMPPIINSEMTGRVTEKTKEIFIECSGFDFNILKKCLNILVTILADMGGKIYSMEINGGLEKISPNLETEENKILLENTNKLLGLNLTEKELKINLEKMGHEYTKGLVKSPCYRTDLLHEVDLIEDIAIAYGYDKLMPTIPEISTIGQESSESTLKRKISEILTGLGFLEISNNHLTTIENQFTKMGIIEREQKDYIELEESKTENNILRKSLTSNSMKVLSENMDVEYPHKTFETGKVFFESNKKIIEEERLSIAISPGNFTDLKQVLEYFSRMINLEIKIEEPNEQENYFIEGRCAIIKLNNKKIGEIGEVHPKILRNWKIKMPVTLLEINLIEIFKELI
jgi:phenylalanyl-tRNA synthetase beta chain